MRRKLSREINLPETATRGGVFVVLCALMTKALDLFAMIRQRAELGGTRHPQWLEALAIANRIAEELQSELRDTRIVRDLGIRGAGLLVGADEVTDPCSAALACWLAAFRHWGRGVFDNFVDGGFAEAAAIVKRSGARSK